MRTPTWYNLIFLFALAGAGALIPQMGVSLCNAKVQGRKARHAILIINPGLFNDH